MIKIHKKKYHNYVEAWAKMREYLYEITSHKPYFILDTSAILYGDFSHEKPYAGHSLGNTLNPRRQALLIYRRKEEIILDKIWIFRSIPREKELDPAYLPGYRVLLEYELSWYKIYISRPQEIETEEKKTGLISTTSFKCEESNLGQIVNTLFGELRSIEPTWVVKTIKQEKGKNERQDICKGNQGLQLLLS
jgi:hypothetical protein